MLKWVLAASSLVMVAVALLYFAAARQPRAVEDNGPTVIPVPELALAEMARAEQARSVPALEPAEKVASEPEAAELPPAAPSRDGAATPTPPQPSGTDPSPATSSATARALPPIVPGQPAALRAVVREGRVVLEWLPVEMDGAAAHYEVRRGAQLVYRGAATSFSEGSLRAGVEHCWDVRSIDPLTRAASASVSACAVPPDVSPPTAPQSVVAKARSDTAIDLVWLASSDDVAVARYEVRRGDGPASAVSALAFSETGLRPAVTYCYTVEAIDAAGNRSPATPPSCVTTPDLQPPSVPANVATSPGGKHAVVVAWAPSTDDVGGIAYEVFQGETMIARAGGTSLTHPGLKVAVEYCYTVRAFDDAGNRSARSKPACITLPDVDPPTKPQDLIAAANSSNRVALQWTASTDDVGVAQYEIVSGSDVVQSVPVTSTAVQGLAPDREYCFEIRALDAAGNRSAASARACSKTAKRGTPSAPFHVRVNEVSSETVTLVWEPSETPSVAYRVYTTGDKLVGATRDLTFTDTGTRIKQKCYRVGAVDQEFRESPKTIPVCAAGSGALTAVIPAGH